MIETTALDLLAKRVRHLETLEEIMSNIHGWDGAAWRKLPIVWGYSNVYGEYESEDNVAAADHILTFSTVPDGEVWVITSFLAYCAQADPTLISLKANVGGVATFLWRGPYPTANASVAMLGTVVLKEDDFLTAIFAGCALNNDIRASAVGYIMKVAE